MSFAITNGLCSLSDVKAALGITDTVDDDRISLAIDAASRLIEASCSRIFTRDDTPSARRYVSNDPWLVEVDDIATTVGMVVQSDYAGDGTFGTTWSTSDYQTEPVNGVFEGQTGWPITKIRAISDLYFPVWGGIAYPKPYTQALVEVTAVWGWPSIPSPVQKAAVIQSISLFKADDVPFGATPFAEVGVIRLRTALHPTAELLVAPFREETVLVA